VRRLAHKNQREKLDWNELPITVVGRCLKYMKAEYDYTALSRAVRKRNVNEGNESRSEKTKTTRDQVVNWPSMKLKNLQVRSSNSTPMLLLPRTVMSMRGFHPYVVA
jgi:hypothetical protein